MGPLPALQGHVTLPAVIPALCEFGSYPCLWHGIGCYRTWGVEDTSLHPLGCFQSVQVEGCPPRTVGQALHPLPGAKAKSLLRGRAAVEAGGELGSETPPEPWADALQLGAMQALGCHWPLRQHPPEHAAALRHCPQAGQTSLCPIHPPPPEIPEEQGNCAKPKRSISGQCWSGFHFPTVLPGSCLPLTCHCRLGGPQHPCL